MAAVHLVTTAQWPALLTPLLMADDLVVLTAHGLSAVVPDSLPCPVHTLGQNLTIEQLAEQLTHTDRSVTW